jgi:hypothetical protein
MSLESIREFEVSDDGTLREPDFPEPEKRYQCYEAVFNWWDRSQKDLTNAMEECQPLAWEVHSLYSNFRENLAAEIETAENEEQPDAEKIATSRQGWHGCPKNLRKARKTGCLGWTKVTSKKISSRRSATGFPNPPIGAHRRNTYRMRLPRSRSP